jgi:peptidylprolyl isomerase
MTPQTGDTVCIYHRVSTEDGEQIESSYTRKKPFTFTIDSGRVIRGMNEAIKDMEKGSHLTIVVPAAQAHGEYSPSKHRKVRKTAFYAGVKTGQTLTFQGDLGQPVQARVLQEEGECLVIDMNHPLAGKNLTVEIELVDIIKEHTREPFI